MPDMVPNASYLFSCSWSAVADLRSTCKSMFVTTFPSTSENAAPEVTSNKEVSATYSDYDPCEIHAFCYACASTNKYCEAVANFYTGSNDSLINFSGACICCIHDCRAVVK